MQVGLPYYTYHANSYIRIEKPSKACGKYLSIIFITLIVVSQKKEKICCVDVFNI